MKLITKRTWALVGILGAVVVIGILVASIDPCVNLCATAYDDPSFAGYVPYPQHVFYQHVFQFCVGAIIPLLAISLWSLGWDLTRRGP